MSKKRIWISATTIAVAAVLGLGVTQSNAVNLGGWLSFMHGNGHDSYNSADASVTPSNVGQLKQVWKWRGDAATKPGQPGPSLFSSPTVANGSIYIGANNGYFYMLNEATGAVQHKVFIGFRPALTCSARGFISTAAVEPDPVTGQSTVYVGAPDGYLYAFNANDLSIRWRSVIDIPSNTINDYFQWSSPTIANGKIYIGSASHCDKPLTRGAVVAYDQATGSEIARHYTVPAGVLGGGVWSSVAVDGQGDVYATTGTQPKDTKNRYEAVSIIKLDGANLGLLGKFTIPDSELNGDADFGGSPTIFNNDVGACNKNGIYYALNRDTMTVDWQVRMGVKSNSASPSQCSSAAIWDGSHLFYASDPTTINGVNVRGSVREVNPTNGAFIWQKSLPNSVIGAPTMSGGGVIAVGTFDMSATPNAVYLMDKTNGTIVRTLNTGGKIFAQTIFADGYVFTTNIGKGMYAYNLS